MRRLNKQNSVGYMPTIDSNAVSKNKMNYNYDNVFGILSDMSPVGIPMCSADTNKICHFNIFLY